MAHTVLCLQLLINITESHSVLSDKEVRNSA